MLLGNLNYPQVQPALFGKGFTKLPGFIRVLNTAIDPQPDIQTICRVSQPREHFPQAQRVFASRNCNQNAFSRAKHLILLDEALSLAWNPFEVVLFAER